MLSRLVSLLCRSRAGQRLIEDLRAAARPLVDPAATFPLQNWWEPSFWEHTVALAIRDHCRPGEVVFEVGANAGALALLMSRLVGPRGIVCAFEARPRIIDKTQYNLVKAGCHNVTLFHKAVWHTTGDLLNIEAGAQLNDRVTAAATGMAVRSVALDDFAAAGDFRPSFIKGRTDPQRPIAAARPAAGAPRRRHPAAAPATPGRRRAACCVRPRRAGCRRTRIR